GGAGSARGARRASAAPAALHRRAHPRDGRHPDRTHACRAGDLGEAAIMTCATWPGSPNRAFASFGACRRFAAILTLTLAACVDRTEDAHTAGAHEGVA